MKKKQLIGLGLGLVAGIIDIIPMIIQNLTWDANLSALCMWVVVGFLIASIELKVHSILKGFITAFLVLVPVAILIGWKEPVSLIPIAIMTTLLGAALGFAIDKLARKYK